MADNWLDSLCEAPEPEPGSLVDRALAARPTPHPWPPYALGGLGAAVAAVALTAPRPTDPPQRQVASTPPIATPPAKLPTLRPSAPRATIRPVTAPSPRVAKIETVPDTAAAPLQRSEPTIADIALGVQTPRGEIVLSFQEAQDERPATLTPLPKAPPTEGYTATFLRSGARVQGTIALRRTASNQVIHGALFDPTGALLATTTTPAAPDGRAALAFDYAPTLSRATHFLVAFGPPLPPPPQVIAGYLHLSFAGTLDPSPAATLRDPEFVRANADGTIGAKVAVEGDGPVRIDGALFDRYGGLRATATAMANLQRGVSQNVALNFGAVEEPARFRLVARPAPSPAPPEERGAMSFTVAGVAENPDGSLTLSPAPTAASWDEILKNPSLRDQKSVVLTHDVVRALKARGPLDLKHATIRATGKREGGILLCFPAVAVEKVTVERIQDFEAVHLPRGPYPAQEETPAERVAKLDALRAKGESVYPLVIGAGFDRLVNAAAKTDHAALVALVQHAWFGGPQEATKGGNALTWAAYYPDAAPVRTLLAQGVAPGVADATGKTGLHRTYREEIARLLLEKGAPVDARDRDGQTPLIAQAQAGNLWIGRGVLALLLAKGADPNAVDRNGKTALMYAAAAGMADDVAALLAKGADPKRRDKDGKTALELTRPWAWQLSPGFATQEILDQQRQRAEADRIRELLKEALSPPNARLNLRR